MKKSIWIFQTGEPLPFENKYRGMRLTNLYNKAKNIGEDVLVISTNFNHTEKKFREENNSFLPFILKKDIVLIKSIGYKKNISLLRILDHTILALNLFLFLILSKKYFNKPAISFIGFPPIEWAFIAAVWSKFNKVKTIIDIKDLWPEIFYENKKFFKKSIIYIFSLPYSFLKHTTLYLSDKVCLPTKSYANECLKIHPKLKSSIIVSPLVPPEDLSNYNSEIKNFYFNNENIQLKFDGLSIIFIGSLMATAYDFEKVFFAIKKFKAKNTDKKIRFLICGNGPLFHKLEEQIYKNSLSKEIKLVGWVKRKEMCTLAKYSDVAIAPYKNINNYKGHIPNKIIDYLQLGLPIISSLKIEFENLIKKNKIGFSYETEYDLIKLIEKISNLKNKSLLEYKTNARKLWENNFKTGEVYKNLIENLKNV